MPNKIDNVPWIRHDHKVAAKVISDYTGKRVLKLEMYEDRYGSFACRASLKGKAEPFYCLFRDNAIQEENLEEVMFTSWPPTAFSKEVGESMILTSRFNEADARRSDKPIKAHADVVDKFLEVTEMQEALQRQADAIQALVSEKAKHAGVLAAEFKAFANEYENQTIRTKKILMRLKDIPEEKSKSVSWKQYIDWSLGKFMSVSADLHKEAQAFLEATKRMIPGRKEIEFQKVESASPISSLLSKLKGTAKRVDDLEAVVKKLE